MAAITLFPDIFKYIFFKQDAFSLIQISLKVVTEGAIDNKSALV